MFKRDRKGNLIDAHRRAGDRHVERGARRGGELHRPARRAPSGRRHRRPRARNERDGKPVHLKDIHLERGMHCVDCHFKQDTHGNGKLYGEPRDAVEITCVDCHGTTRRRAYGNDPAPASWTLRTTGPAAPEGGGTNLLSLNTPFDRPRFQADPRTRRLIQRSMTSEDLSWLVPQVMDTITPGNPLYNERARLAKTMQRDGKTLGRRRVAQPRARRRADDLHHLSLVVDHELLRLPSVADGQPEARRAAQRGQDHAQLDVVQLPGAARRRLHARQGQHGDARPHLAGALVERRRGELAGQNRQMHLRPAADGVGGGLRRPGVQHPRAAHRARRPKPRPAPTATSRPTATTTR